MTQPDWSKAPEGATHYDAAAEFWCNKHGFWCEEGVWYIDSSQIGWGTDRYIPRPTSNTQGLPEVGEEYLVSIMGDEFRAKITYVGDGVFCYKDLDNDTEYSGATEDTEFFPIPRTITISGIDRDSEEWRGIEALIKASGGEVE